MAERTFKDLVIAVTGIFTGYKHQGLKTIIEGLGATFSEKITPHCTHLVASKAEVKTNGHKFIKACNLYNCEIVTVQWLLDSWRQNKPLLEDAYLVSSKAAASNADDIVQQTEDRKRSLEEALGMDKYEPRKAFKVYTGVDKASLKIPAHEACSLRHGWSVYIDNRGDVYDATLTQTIAGDKKNNYYRLQVLVDSNETEFRCWACWGRVGGAARTWQAKYPEAFIATWKFQRRFRAKTGILWAHRYMFPSISGKFKFVERSFEGLLAEASGSGDAFRIGDKSSEVKCTLVQSMQDVISFIFNKDNFTSVTTSIAYDSRKLPLGKLSKETLCEGYLVLKQVSELISDPSLADQKYQRPFSIILEELSTKYFSTIPHVFGWNQTPTISNERHIRKELGFIEDLTDIAIANNIMESAKAQLIHPLDCQFQGLRLQEMTPRRDSTEFQELETYFRLGPNMKKYKVGRCQPLLSQPGRANGLQIIDIFRIRRNGEKYRFKHAKYERPAKSNRRLLWHGSRSTNFAGILTEGLRISPAAVPKNGSTLGNGIYFADVAEKSINFSVGGPGNKMLLLLCDVELGDPMHEVERDGVTRIDPNMPGTISIRSQGSYIPITWKDATCIYPDLEGVKVPLLSAPRWNTRGRIYHPFSEYVVQHPAQVQMKYLFFFH